MGQTTSTTWIKGNTAHETKDFGFTVTAAHDKGMTQACGHNRTRVTFKRDENGKKMAFWLNDSEMQQIAKAAPHLAEPSETSALSFAATLTDSQKLEFIQKVIKTKLAQ